MRIITTIKFRGIEWIGPGIVVFFIFLGLFPRACFSQDLYNKENSQKYAEYLLSSRQHTLAAEEFERLVYFDGENVRFKYYLIKSYRLAGDLQSGIRRVYSFYGNSPDTMPQIVAVEFLKLQLLSDSLVMVENFLEHRNNLSFDEKEIFRCSGLLLNGEYKKANTLAKEYSVKNSAFPPSILNLSDKAKEVKLKSPVAAAVFSAIIPGTGKFYTRNWSDGLFSLLFVAGDAWQAYRGFSEHGSKSFYGWAFAGLSASFYVGNVFGSVKAARRYNKNKRDEIDYQVLELVRSDSF